MSVMRHGYGSEWHLRSLLATQPERVSNEILSVLASAGLSSVREVIWHPDYLKIGAPEFRGLDFLESSSAARQEWRKWWPETGKCHSWDAIGTIHHGGGETDWLLVEAKANVQEVRSNCGAKEHGGLPLIRSGLRETQDAIGVEENRNWIKGHYQYANRLALLHFLHCRGVAARLMFLYFVGDRGDKRRDCPQSVEEWKATLTEMKKTLGLTGRSELEKHVHEVFVVVEPCGEPHQVSDREL